MIAAWNVVNLCIATFGCFGVVNGAAGISTNELLSEMEQIEQILLINARLDFLYIGAETILWKRALFLANDRLPGYGKSMVLQETFLLAF